MIYNIGKANARIAELREQLGLPKAKKVWNIRDANDQIEDMEKQLAAKPAYKPAAATPTLPPLPPAPKLSRKECTRIMSEVFFEAPMLFAAVSDADLLEDVTARITAARLACPPLGIAAGESPARNMEKLARASMQGRLDTIFKKR